MNQTHEAALAVISAWGTESFTLPVVGDVDKSRWICIYYPILLDQVAATRQKFMWPAGWQGHGSPRRSREAHASLMS